MEARHPRVKSVKSDRGDIETSALSTLKLFLSVRSEILIRKAKRAFVPNLSKLNYLPTDDTIGK